MDIKVAIPVLNIDANDEEPLIIYDNGRFRKQPTFMRANFITDYTLSRWGYESMNEMIYHFSFTWLITENITQNIPHEHYGPILSKNVNLYLNSLWFVKDNNANMQDSYTIIPEINFHSRHPWVKYYSTCTCDSIITYFTKEELTEGLVWRERIFNICRLDANGNVAPLLTGNSLAFFNNSLLNIDYNADNRIARAFLFLDEARNTSIPLMKLSSYMNIYECLFTTDRHNITAKLSKRSAYYFTSDDNERIELEKFIKTCYSIRSTYYHGNQLGTEAGHDPKTFIKDALIRLDNLTRNILKRAFTVDTQLFLQTDGDLKQYFEVLTT
jgi:hypothetical protein